MPASNSPKKKSGVCPKCKQKFSFELEPGLASVECPHCHAKIRLKAKAKKKTPPSVDAKSKNKPATHSDPSTADSTDVQPSEANTDRNAEANAEISPETRDTTIADTVADTVADTSVKEAPEKVSDAIEIVTKPPSLDSLSIDSPEPATSLPTIKVAKDLPKETEEDPVEPIARLVPKKDLLPPKFIVDQASANVVILPSADGGTQVIDPNVVHIKHGNQTISLTALTPTQRARRRAIQNFVILLLAALMLAAAIWILL